MKKEFNYTIKNDMDITKNLNEFNDKTREDFKVKMYKLNYKTFNDASKCFDPSFSIRQSDKCISDAFAPLKDYDSHLQSVWTPCVEGLKSCTGKCKNADTVCLSKCFNDSMSKIYSGLYEFHKTIP